MRRRDRTAGPDIVPRGFELERRVLEELVYERVKLSVDLCELIAFERDLHESIERALDEHSARRGEERTDLSMEMLLRAWRRLSDELAADLLAAQMLVEPRGPRP